MKKVMLPALLLASALLNLSAWSAPSGVAMNNPPFCYVANVPNCREAPDPYAQSRVTYGPAKIAGSTYGQFVISQPIGAQSWRKLYSSATYFDNTPDTAFNQCQRQDTNCKTLLRFEYTCASAVKGGYRQATDGQALFTATGKTSEQANAKATAQCQANSLGNCQVIASQCAVGSMR